MTENADERAALGHDPWHRASACEGFVDQPAVLHLPIEQDERKLCRLLP